MSRVKPLYEPPQLIAIEGPLRVGKTSLADCLAKRLGASRLRDDEDNPFLGRFYKGAPEAAFQTQLYFLMRRFKQWQGLDLGGARGRRVVSDYLFDKDKIFAYVNLSDQELSLYEQYFEVFAGQVPIPDLVIYLQAKLDTLKDRIVKKRVPAEQRISDEYLSEVIEAYDHFFFHYKATDLLVVDTSTIDFIKHEDDLEDLLQRIRQPVKGTQYFLPLGSASAD